MKIIKFEKDGCVPCAMVSNFLDDQGVDYESVNVFASQENTEKAQKHGVMMQVPVTVLVDDNGEVVKSSTGFKPGELQEIVDGLK